MEYFEREKNTGFIVFMNLAGMLGICAALLMAFYYQLALFELPCPLCLLQRAGLIIAGCGFLFNIRQGAKGTHYGMVLIGCLVTGMIAGRQILLHIMPSDPGYGSAFLGLHFYTWALISSITIALIVVVMVIADNGSSVSIILRPAPILKNIVSGLFVLLIVGNLVSTVLECGKGQCSDDPVRYELLQGF